MKLTPETIAWLCCGSVEEAHHLVTSVRVHHSEEVLEHVIRALVKPRPSRGTFADLDSMLRPDVTLKKIVHPRAAVEWGVKRACLVSGLQCLGDKTRVVYVLRDVFSWTPTTTAMVLGTSDKIVATRLTLARNRLNSYYQKRCVHLHPGNRCSCRGRVGSALQAGLVRLPILGRLPTEPHDAKPAIDLADMIRGLPVPLTSL